METIVFQSYRDTDVAPWISRCLDSVKQWSARQKFEYRFFGDEFFSYLPDWFSGRVGHSILPMTDLARLIVAREILDSGCNRVIWVDADVVVFNPDNFSIDVESEFAFCQETWLSPGLGGKLVSFRRVNNAVSVFLKNNSFLDFYINACLRKVRSSPLMDHLGIGTRFLSSIFEIAPFPLLKDVGMMSPTALQGIVANREDILSSYRRWSGSPVNAANLCASLVGKTWFGCRIEESLYDRAVDVLLSKGHDVFEKYIVR